MDDYNNNHPHESLNDMIPVKFLRSKYREKMPTFTVLEKGLSTGVITLAPDTDCIIYDSSHNEPF